MFSRKYRPLGGKRIFHWRPWPTAGGGLNSLESPAMFKPFWPLLTAGALIMPAQASAASFEHSEDHPGAFVGARIQLSLGGKSSRKARAALAIAPTSSRIAGGSIVQTRIGEGISLNFDSRPNLTLAGVRADRALGLASARGLDSGRKLGLSKGGWIAVGVGVAVVGAAIYGFSVYDEARDNTD